jgi:hypothetical protein
MLQSSHQWTKTDAWAAHFPVSVAANGTSVLRNRTRVNYKTLPGRRLGD